MNITRLREIQTAFADAAAELEKMLVEAEGQRDPLVSHIYRSRIAYGRACDLDQTKS